MKTYLLAGVAALALASAGHAWAGPDRSTSWKAQIGDTATVNTQAKGGAGVTIGFVDTGVVATNTEFTGRVSGALSACSAVTFACSNGYTDDNGHGTATAAIAAGVYSASIPVSMSGVAPGATIIAEKSLNKSGAGYDTDVASGITKATDAGAQVINLSLSYTPTAAVINAINYAAAHNVVLVWAGGNSPVNFNGGASTTGLTTAALSRLIFVGSVNASNMVSTFSAKPGSAYAAAGKTRVSYSQLWLMAPGESITAPATMSGPTSFASWSGTSMSAPEVSGAVALLEATWPVLVRNGTASAVLFSSATNLGASGTYGNGLLNITKAFQPVGTTSIVTSTGATQTVTVLSGQVLTAGMVGSMPGLKDQLSHYTTFDSFQRNFTSDLSGLIVTPTHGAGAGSTGSVSSTPTVTSRVGFTGGGYMLVSQSAPQTLEEAYFTEVGQASGRLTPGYNPPTNYLALVDKRGDMAAIGRGVSGAAAFAEASFGPGSVAASQYNALGVSTALFNVAGGGRIGALGLAAGSRLRLSAGWSESDPVLGMGGTGPISHSMARAGMFGVSAKVSGRLTLGAAISTLSEDNAMLGATYQGDGVLSLGERHHSRSVSLTGVLDLGGGRTLLADYAWADTSGAAPATGVLRSLTDLHARAFGLSLVQQDAFQGGDRLTLSVSKPMRLTSGVASLAITTVDGDGYASTSFTPVSLVPNGDETDLSVAYWVPMGKSLSLSAGLDLRQDALNVRGQNDGRVKLGLSLRF
jgi:subtilisin family serine protease